MPDKTGTHLRQVTWFWAILWLVATLVIGINATVVLHQYQVTVTEPTMRLAGILLIGEVLLYFIVLMLPTERIVPPGRTLLAVAGAVGVRVIMAIIAAQMAILAGDTTAFGELWRIMHGSFWLGGLLQMALLALYLWLIRSALEVPRPQPGSYPRSYRHAGQPEQDRTPRPSEEQVRQRQEQLLSALMENPDAPVETPLERDAQGEPLPGVSAEAPPEAQVPADDQVPALLRVPRESVTQPPPVPTPEQPAATDAELPAACDPEPDSAEVPAAAETAHEPVEATDSMPPVPDTATTEPAEAPPPTEPPAVAEPSELQPEPAPPATEQPPEHAAQVPAETPAEPEAPPLPADRLAADMPAQPTAPSTPETEVVPGPTAETPPEPEPAEPSEPTAPEPAAEVGAVPTPEQDFVLRNALNRVVPGQTVETALSPAGRIHALVGLSAETSPEGLPKALDLLRALAQSATAAMHGGDAQTVLLMAEPATLVAAISADTRSQIVIQSPAETKLGQLTLLGRRAAQVAADVQLGNHCLQPAIERHELPPDPSWAAQQAADLPGPVLAFTGAAHTVLTTASSADAPAVAGAAEHAYQAAVEVAEALQLGAVNRLLVEGTSGGLVIGPGDTETDVLLAVLAETTAKMGAANVTLTRMRDALRGEG